MFNLEQAIKEWRQQQSAAGIQTPVPMEELESHLRDEIERLTESGLSEAEAFPAAVEKIGAAQMIQSEFRKVEASKADRQWQVVQIMLEAATALIPIFIGWAVFFNRGGFADMSPGQSIASVAAGAAFSLLAWSGRLSYRLFLVIPTKQIRYAVGYSSGMMGLWWCVFFNLIMPRYDFTTQQMAVTFLWGSFAPAGAFLGFIWGMETAARKKVALTS